MAININTTAASAISDLLSLALQMGVQAQENKWRAEEAEKDRKAKAANIYLNNMLNQENMIIKSRNLMPLNQEELDSESRTTGATNNVCQMKNYTTKNYEKLWRSRV